MPGPVSRNDFRGLGNYYSTWVNWQQASNTHQENWNPNAETADSGAITRRKWQNAQYTFSFFFKKRTVKKVTKIEPRLKKDQIFVWKNIRGRFCWWDNGLHCISFCEFTRSFSCFLRVPAILYVDFIVSCVFMLLSACLCVFLRVFNSKLLRVFMQRFSFFAFLLT